MRVATRPVVPVDAPTRKRYTGLLKVVVPAAIVLGAFAFWNYGMKAPAQGSREDLAGRLDAVVPDSMQQIDEFYNTPSECAVAPPCPSVTRYYSIQGSIEAARDQAVEIARDKGLEIKPNSVEPNLIVASEDEYVYFLVFHPPPQDGPLDKTLPSYVEADLTISLNRAP